MAITSTNQNINNLVINKVPSPQVFQKMKNQNLINDNELYLVDGSEFNKITFSEYECGWPGIGQEWVNYFYKFSKYYRKDVISYVSNL